MSPRLQCHRLLRSVCAFSPTGSPVLGWGSQFLLGILHELPTHRCFDVISTVPFSFCSPVPVLPSRSIPALTCRLSSLDAKWSLATSYGHIQPAPRGETCHQSDRLSISPAFRWLTTYLSSGTISVSVGVDREVQFVRQIKADFLCLKREWEHDPLHASLLPLSFCSLARRAPPRKLPIPGPPFANDCPGPGQELRAPSPAQREQALYLNGRNQCLL